MLIFNRLVEGFSFGLIQSTVYGVSSQELEPAEFEKYARTCSAFSGLGSCLSLILGPFLFSLGGYFLPYFILSGSFLILLAVIYISGVLNEKPRRKIELVKEFNEELFQITDEDGEDTSKNIDIRFILGVPVSILLI